jgi:membrane protease subunit HflC
MSSVLRTGLLILGVAIAVLAQGSLFVVSERDKVLVTQFGQIVRSIDEPGLYVKLPFVQEAVRIEKRLVFFESDNKSVQVVDSRRYLVDAIAMYRVVDNQKFRESVGANIELANQRVMARLDAALRGTYGRRTFQAALSEERGVMMREIRDAVLSETRELGVDIVDVRIRRTDLPRDVLEQTYGRMGAERKAEAEQIRAVGNQQSLTIRAETDRDYTVLLAKAQRDAEIIRGKGDADRNRVFAEAFTVDPEFFAFYRSMQAYQKSLPGDGTTLVLRPEGSFFKYFGTGAPTNGKAAP